MLRKGRGREGTGVNEGTVVGRDPLGAADGVSANGIWEQVESDAHPCVHLTLVYHLSLGCDQTSV